MAKRSKEHHRLKISQRYAQGMSKTHINLYIKDGTNGVEVHRNAVIKVFYPWIWKQSRE